MKKLFWLGVGITVGVIAARKVAQAKGNLGPAGLNRAVGRVSDSVLDFASSVRENMNQREADLRSALGVSQQQQVDQQQQVSQQRQVNSRR